jgi:hypothetical protein
MSVFGSPLVKITCPYCKTLVHVPEYLVLNEVGPFSSTAKDGEYDLALKCLYCSACKKTTAYLVWGKRKGTQGFEEIKREMVIPRHVVPSLPSGIPEILKTQFIEASFILNESPRASAALGRRCLQTLLREYARIKPSDLASEIQQVLDQKALPSYLAQAIDSVRTIGNFGAHPIKSKDTGEIVEVEPGEAEWLLQTLEGLFDFYFAQQTRLKEMKERLNEKLRRAGKPEVR